ncbi:hypothetical protein PLESTF_001406700 [Pleodorina starrii]|nr:hypothetical protein PLESTM_001526800 [Pleodorina starrii]GLC73670.1 hypothetical protein PLESTF_001406700 [Pleodorina starrii]
MDSPSRWQSAALEQDVLPSTSAFVAPGQENFFLAQAQCLDGSPGRFRTGSVPASPSQLQAGLLLHGGYPGDYPGLANHHTNQEFPAQSSSSPGNRAQQPFPPQLYPTSPALSHQAAAHLVALDVAAASHSPNHGALPGSPTRMFPSPSAPSHLGLDSGLGMYGAQLSYMGYDAASQYGQALQRQQLGQQQLSAPQLGQRLAAAAATAAGLAADAAAVGQLQNLPYGMSMPHSLYAPYPQPQPGSPHSHASAPQALMLRSGVADQYGGASFPLPPPPLPHQSPPNSSAQGPFPRATEPSVGGAPAAAAEARFAGPAANESARAGSGAGREGGNGPGSIWVGPDGAAHMAPPPLPAAQSSPAAMKAGPGGPMMGSPHSPRGGLPGMAGGGGGMHGGAVRHVVEELRTSPLIFPSDYETPVRPGMGGGGGRSMGGAAHGGFGGGGGGGSAERNVVAQRYQAQILSLERQNAELQKRLADVQAALDASQTAKQALEAKQDAMADQVAQANQHSKSRESALESARRANDALSGELRGCQEELAAARNALAAAKDTAVQWQDRAMEVGKELEAARKKIETLGEEERRLSSETMSLRKEVQQLNDVIIKGRIESAELREKLRGAQQETARAASTAHAVASRAESEQEGAAVQLACMRNKVVELESRNSQLMYDMAGLREEVARSRQAADAAKAALAAKPAGIASDGGTSARQHPHSAWMAHDCNPSGGGGAYGAYSGGAYGGAMYGGSIGAGGGGGGYAAAGGGGHGGTSYGGSTYGGGSAGGSVVAAAGGGAGSIGGGSTHGSVGGASFGRPPLPPQPGAFPPSQPEQAAAASNSGGSATAAAVLRELPPDIAFSKLDPETFRSMVRAEAEALARGNGGGGMYRHESAPQTGANSPRKTSYGTRYSGDLAAEPGGSSGAPPLPPRSAWGAAADGPTRDMVAAGPLADARGMWRPPPQGEDRSFGGGGGGGGGGDAVGAGLGWQPQTKLSSAGGTSSSAGGGGGGGPNYGSARGSAPPSAGGGGGSPPPYAVHTTDNSYAYRRPANAVGAGTAPSGGGGGDTPYGTEETVKDMVARSKALEDQLMVLCAEKGGLEAEYARMPLGAGRSLRERNRKAVVEQRLDLLNKEISSVRMQLKRLGMK